MKSELTINLGLSPFDHNVNQSKLPKRNRIETSKYNAFTFFPKNLIVQFRKLANLYFIIIGVCQAIRRISTTDGKPIIFMPLSIMVLISMVKDWVEDRKRRRRDQEENLSKAWRLHRIGNDYIFQEVTWETLMEGDIIRVKENQKFPADTLILSTTVPGGTCYIETKNLDGETNLKHRGSILPSAFRSDSDVINASTNANFKITYEGPNEYLHRFDGILIEEASETRTLLSIENTAFRGCILKNTQQVLGVVIYAGHSCKSLMNANSGQYKFSTIEKGMNRMVVTVFCVLILTSMFCSLYYALWYDTHAQQLPYLYINKQRDSERSVFVDFLAHIPLWVLLLNTFVPISLLMTLEMVRYFQGHLLSKDKNFTNQISDELVEVNGSNLIDQLGSVSYVLTDKTGTLTGNSMKFKALSVNSMLHEHPNFDDKHPLHSQELIRRLHDPQRYPIETEAMICMNLCHQQIVELIDGKIHYSGASADEQCFMEFCTATGFYYKGIDADGIMTIADDINKRTLTFRLLEIHEYESSLAKMSVLVQDLQTQQFKCYQKGSAYEIYKCLRDIKHQPVDLDITQKHIDYFASNILRTLCLSFRELSNQQTSEFLTRLNREMMSCSVSSLKHTKSQIFHTIESEHTLIGGTGVNDEFQDQVPETLASLRKSGIKVWMITGDKKETALSIAHRCGMVYDGVHLQVFDNPSEAGGSHIVSNNDQSGFSQERLTACQNYIRDGKRFAVGISGIVMVSLQSLPNSSEVYMKFLQVFGAAESIIAYHFTPRQKQQLVILVNRIQPNATVLAIGDGANDVQMIQAAHVGVGIRGKEGREAAKSADFSLGEFKHLNRLILYVGQEAYRKNSQLIFFNFYKNQAWNLTYVWFNFFCGMSGQYIYDQWVAQFFNILFAAVPIIVFALFDEQHPSEHDFQPVHTDPNQLEFEPQTYKQFIKKPLFTQRNFVKSFLHGSVHALVLVYISFLCFGDSTDQNGRRLDIFQQGMYAFTLCVIVCNLKVFQLHNTHSGVSVISLLFGIVTYLIVIAIASHLRFLDSFDILTPVFLNGKAYICMLLVILMTYGFDSAVELSKKQTRQVQARILAQDSLTSQSMISIEQPLLFSKKESGGGGGATPTKGNNIFRDQDTDESDSLTGESSIIGEMPPQVVSRQRSATQSLLPPQKTYSLRSDSHGINTNINQEIIHFSLSSAPNSTLREK